MSTPTKNLWTNFWLPGPNRFAYILMWICSSNSVLEYWTPQYVEGQNWSDYSWYILYSRNNFHPWRLNSFPNIEVLIWHEVSKLLRILRGWTLRPFPMFLPWKGTRMLWAFRVNGARLLLWWGLVFMYNEKLVVYCKFSMFFCLVLFVKEGHIHLYLHHPLWTDRIPQLQRFRWVVDSALRILDTQRQRLEDREAFPPTASWLSYGLAMSHQSW